MTGGLGKTRSGASYGKKPKKKEVAGPYQSQSSVKSIRDRATKAEHRKVVPTKPSKPSLATTKAGVFDPVTPQRFHAKTRQERKQAKHVSNVIRKLTKPIPQTLAGPGNPKNTPVLKRLSHTTKKMTHDEELERVVDTGITGPLEKAGYHKTTGQKIGEGVFKAGYIAANLIPFAAEIEAGAKAAQLGARGVEAGGLRFGGTKAIQALTAPEKIETAAARTEARVQADRAAGKAIEKAKGYGSRTKRIAARVARTEGKQGRAAAREVTGTKTAKETFAGSSPLTMAAKGGSTWGLPVVRGHAYALSTPEGRSKTAKSTARILPGLVTAPVGAAANIVGIPAGRAVSEGLHTIGVPGFKGYSGSEITQSAKKEVEQQVAFGKEIGKTLTASDPDYVKKEVENDLGLMLPGMLAIGAAGIGRAISKGKLEGIVRDRVNAVRERRGVGRGPDAPVFAKTAERKGASVTAANAIQRARRETADRTRRIRIHAGKAKGKEVLREARTEHGKKKKVTIYTGDTIPFLVREGIDLSDPKRALEQVKHVGRVLKPIPEGWKVGEDAISTRDVIKYIEDHPNRLEDPDLKLGVAHAKEQARYAREHAADLAPEHSERARFLSVGKTEGIHLPEERLPYSVLDIARHQPEHGVDAGKALVREAKADRRAAKSQDRKAARLELRRQGAAREAAIRERGIEPRLVETKRREAAIERAANRVAKGRDKLTRVREPKGEDVVIPGRAAGGKVPFRNVRDELDAIASESLHDELESWGHWTPEQARNLAHVLRAELDEGLLSAEHFKAEGRGPGRIRTEAKMLLARVEREAPKSKAKERWQAYTERAEADLQKGLAEKERRAGHTGEGARRVASRYQGRAELAKTRGEITRQRAEQKRLAGKQFPDDERLQDFIREAEATGKTPEYVATGHAPIIPSHTASGAKLRPFPGASKFSSGKAVEHGMAQEGLLPYLRESIARPISRRESFRAMRKHLDENSARWGTKEEFTPSEARALLDDPHSPYSKEHYIYAPRTLYKRAYDVEKRQAGDYADADFIEASKMRESAKAENQAELLHDLSTTQKGRLVKKAAHDEFLTQLTAEKMLPGIGRANRAAAYLILGTSPSWAAMQILAEYAQATVAQPTRMANPVWVAKALRDYRNMDPKKRWAFDSWTGITNRHITQQKDLPLGLESGDMAAAAEAYGVMNNNRYGRFIKGIPSGIQHIDRWKGGHIRALTTMAKLDKDTNGKLNRFLRGMGGLYREGESATNAMKKMPLKDQLNYWADHPEAAQKYGNYLDDVMGNWSALTKNERLASQVAIFYPFLRMSLRWTFKSFPKRHPIKAMLGVQMAQQNANALKGLLSNEPSFFQKWGQVPIYTKEGAKPRLMDLSRIAPGSNALIEAIGGSTDVGQAALRVTQPWVNAAITATTGVVPLSGDQVPNKGIEAIANLFSLSPVERELDRLLVPGGEKRAQGTLPLFGKTERKEALDKLFDQLRGSGPSEVIRKNFLPFLPKDVDTEADTAKLSKILDTLSSNDSDKLDELAEKGRTSGTSTKKVEAEARKVGHKADKAQAELDKLFEKYGIPFKPESDLFLKYYSAAHYPDESSGGSSGSSGKYDSAFGGSSSDSGGKYESAFGGSSSSGGGKYSNAFK